MTGWLVSSWVVEEKNFPHTPSWWTSLIKPQSNRANPVFLISRLEFKQGDSRGTTSERRRRFDGSLDCLSSCSAYLSAGRTSWWKNLELLRRVVHHYCYITSCYQLFAKLSVSKANVLMKIVMELLRRAVHHYCYITSCYQPFAKLSVSRANVLMKI